MVVYAHWMLIIYEIYLSPLLHSNESFVNPFPPPYDLQAQSPCVDQFRDACAHQSSYPDDVCSYCQSFNYDVNSCPYYNVFDEAYAKLKCFKFLPLKVSPNNKERNLNP